MRYLLIIFCFVAFSFSYILPNDSLVKNLSFNEKKILFKEHKRSLAGNLFINNIIPTLGYARIHKWGRGVSWFFIKPTAAILNGALLGGIFLSDSSKYPILEYTLISSTFTFTTFVYLHIVENIDLYKQTNKYNQQLHNTIFGKSSNNNFSFLVLPTSNGAYLNLSYKF